MTALDRAVEDYLALRRSLGYKPRQESRLLASLAGYLQARGLDRVTVWAAVSWATQPEAASPAWHAKRLAAVRGFSGYLATINPASEVRELERTRDSGYVPGAGRSLTVAQWMETWLTTIAPRRIRRSTPETTYAPKVRNRIIPGLGKHRLERLTPEHIERFYTRLEAEGLAPATVLQIHRILSRALKVATQRGYVSRNVATLVDAPSASQDEIESLTLDEALRIIGLAATRRNGTRWSVALALGLRQGEALGLRWRYVDLDAGTLTIRWQLQRLAWRHGCDDLNACGRSRHRSDCVPGCTSHARGCPRRTGGGLQLTELKSDKSRRTLPLPPQLAAALKTHRAGQLQERMTAGPAWHDGDFVWCQPNGRPIGAHADWDEWRALLEAAGIRQVRVHDARHTAATLRFRPGC